ncbi:serine hydrolase domain-containing protein [Streptomyces sp. TP-A0874]|uniref:serine hydrolase domain-containing protein n=1 Tax=Streptomyces sp. TP-A0874 TaxID=549819 RepID=UPI0009A00421|nr:serine hydrolase domain-containing protein [Streptomyces sp. TP-A0874]
MGVRTARGKIVGVLVALATTGAVFAIPTATALDHSAPAGHQATREAMDAQVAAGVPGVLGEVRVGPGDGRVWGGTAGVADLRTERPRLPEDRFRAGSITKSFVATLVLQLEAEGRLSLDDTVEEWLPGVVRGHGHDGSAVTIRQLLNHTSGVYSYNADPELQEGVFGPGFEKHRFDTWAPRQLVDIAMRHEPDFAPGTAWGYSNTNYVLAGMIVEKATHGTYAEAVERRILAPLGMRSTALPGVAVTMPVPHGRAYSSLGATGLTDEVRDTTELSPTIAGPAGEIISTAGDLNRFYRALLRGELLPEPQQRELLTTVPTGQGSMRYGLGLSVERLSCGVTVYGHGGGIHGSSSLAHTTRDGDHSAVFNINADYAGDLSKLSEAEFCGTD